MGVVLPEHQEALRTRERRPLLCVKRRSQLPSGLAVLEEGREGMALASLKAREKAFFKKAADEIGGHPAVLYSLSKLLNEIGSGFVEDGIAWICGVIERTPELTSRELEINTVYYLENLIRSYLLQDRHKVRTVPQMQHQVLTVLNFLLEKGSATAYLLREDVLC